MHTTINIQHEHTRATLTHGQVLGAHGGGEEAHQVLVWADVHRVPVPAVLGRPIGKALMMLARQHNVLGSGLLGLGIWDLVLRTFAILLADEKEKGG